jgi:hypothetical protein
MLLPEGQILARRASPLKTLFFLGGLARMDFGYKFVNGRYVFAFESVTACGMQRPFGF